MQRVQLTSWDDFLAAVDAIRKDHSLEADSVSPKGLLFRGQSNHAWPLLTTLDRTSNRQNVSLSSYFRKVLCCLPQLEAFHEHKWSIPSLDEYTQHYATFDQLTMFKPLKEEIELMVFLRHHGYPSPLLDWTRSPYIASFFAFADSKPENEYVSINCYLEHSSLGKITSSNAPFIHSLGPYLRSHKRHFLQQSNYTMCLEFIDGEPCYVNHSAVLENTDDFQDQSWAFVIPYRERKKVMTLLDTMNVNAFSLFGSTESLMSTIAFREFEIRTLGT